MERREQRRREVLARRRAKIRKQKIKRLIFVLSILVIIVGIIIFLLVLGIKAIIKAVKKSDDAEIMHIEQVDADADPFAVGKNLPDGVTLEGDGTSGADGSGSLVDGTLADGSGLLTGDALANGAGNSSGGYLGYNSTVAEGAPVVNGVEIYPGYEVKKTDSTYYISSENTQSTFAILIDAKTNEVVCQKEGFTRMYPASMTKIMTVLVAAEHLNDSDLVKNVTITNDHTYYAYKHDLSAVGWDNNETVTVNDLFYGTVLPSGADAAIALAEYVAGDEETFVEMMNEKAKELGLTNTHFTNCVGSYNDNHYSTCADMAMILKAAIENDYLFDVLNAHKYTTTSTALHPDGIEISNWFLRRIEDKDSGGEVLCAKTGYVHQSGSCAASYALQRTGHPYICVTGDAHSAWRAIYDHVDIYLNNTK